MDLNAIENRLRMGLGMGLKMGLSVKFRTELASKKWENWPYHDRVVIVRSVCWGIYDCNQLLRTVASGLSIMTCETKQQNSEKTAKGPFGWRALPSLFVEADAAAHAEPKCAWAADASRLVLQRQHKLWELAATRVGWQTSVPSCAEGHIQTSTLVGQSVARSFPANLLFRRVDRAARGSDPSAKRSFAASLPLEEPKGALFLCPASINSPKRSGKLLLNQGSRLLGLHEGFVVAGFGTRRRDEHRSDQA